MSQIFDLGLKPIFHQNAKSFALGTFALPNARKFLAFYPTRFCPTRFTLSVLSDAFFSDAFYPTRFIRRVLSDAFYLTRFIRRVLPDASQWNIGGVGPSGVGAGVEHVHFIFFV